MTIHLGDESPRPSSNLPGPQTWKLVQRDPYLALLPVGFAMPVCYQTSGALLPHHFNLARTPERAVGGFFLLHFPSAYAAQPLAGTVLP